MLGKTLESPLDSKKIKPVHPRGNQLWIFIRRTDAEAPILWPPDAKNWLTGKALMLGKTEGGRRREDRGWDGWMASPTGWTWVWVSSGSWWWTGKPGMLQSIGSQRLGQSYWTELNWYSSLCSRKANHIRLNLSLEENSIYIRCLVNS